ncbi:MAG: MFS transporter [Nitrospira sp.]|nr:MAG: MFS transporter [Nitrospira sp.]
MTAKHGTSSRTALKFVVLLGVVSLFADMTYEAARSITGPYLALWGIGMGAQESIMRAGVAEMVSPDKRGSAYGVFSTGGFGVC